MSTEAPVRISDREIGINLTGCLVLWNMEEDQPYWLRQPGSDDLWIAGFSSVERRDAFCRDYDLPTACKQISDGEEFFSSVLGKARVALDPYRHENGRMRFIEPISFGAKA